MVLLQGRTCCLDCRHGAPGMQAEAPSPLEKLVTPKENPTAYCNRALGCRCLIVGRDQACTYLPILVSLSPRPSCPMVLRPQLQAEVHWF